MADDDLDDDMDDDEDLDDEEGGSGGGGGKKKILMLAIPLVLIIGGAAGAYFTGLLDPLIGAEESAEGEGGEGGEGGGEAAGPVAFTDLPEILVNLNTTGRKSSFLKIRVSLEVPNALEVDKVVAVQDRVVDAFQVYLRELRVEDLKGSAGMYRLREELLARVNAAVAPVKVNDVLFKEMLVQ
ncbi:Flagellar FliL protein [Candidatus Terasakiella magnetica]|uniref:Flagellar protein FliL n=1 Tax=Candidatus Terasakiella magnetica TaxID=1867952 RepID=A0A1C3RKV2_9PROT|nr:flagellar basal body-associated FliL family protein [Candidatus Terasakiella magnetica]SCA57886.1 Flagellar FliL protein [Candidatus Terasakiella magnetica]